CHSLAVFCPSRSLHSYLSLLQCFIVSDPARSETYTLSLHDALPIFGWWFWRWWHSSPVLASRCCRITWTTCPWRRSLHRWKPTRSEEHTSELQSRENLVCRLLLENKKTRGASLGKSTHTFNVCLRPS